MLRPHRKGDADADGDEDGNAFCSTSPVKDKENLSPSTNGRQPKTVYQKQFLALLQNFDETVAMTQKEMLINRQVLVDKLTLPFLTVLQKMPPKIKNMKWGDYLKLRESEKQGMSMVDKNNTEPQSEMHTFAVPTAKMETPAVRSSSRLAKNKFPAITPKFDPKTTNVNKRLAKPGEMLVSLKGSPVGIPNPMRGLSSLTAGDDSTDTLVALLNNPDVVNNALKDKTAFLAFMKAYNSKVHKK